MPSSRVRSSQMGSIPNTVYYCSVSKEAKVVAQYSRGDPDIENLAALCLEQTPSNHACYFQTVKDWRFGFLMEDGHVYFAIADEGLGKTGIKDFLEHVKDQFKKVLKNGGKGSFRLTSFRLREELVPIFCRLISSLESVPRVDYVRLKDNFSNQCTAHEDSRDLFSINQMDGKTNSRALPEVPLLGKNFKYEKFSTELAEVREDMAEGQEKAVDQGHRIDVAAIPSRRGTGSSAFSMQKSLNSRIKPEELARRTWWHLVKMVLLIDILLCLILFGIWLSICKGFKCLSSQ